MRKAKPLTNWFFVDESGDTTFYNRRRELVVGRPTCPPVFILGFIETTEPTTIRKSLAQLQHSIQGETKLGNIPSLKKSLIAFHAKDDHPEIRRIVFNAIREMKFKAQFIVFRKSEMLKDYADRYNGREETLYDQGTSMLFRDRLHCYASNRIIFAHRGTRARQQPLQDAIQFAVDEFEQRFGRPNSARFLVDSQKPSGEPCISVIDYMNWALYQYFVNDDTRYVELVSDKISLVLDRYHPDGLQRYTRDTPLLSSKKPPYQS